MPSVRIPGFHCCGPGSIPDQGTKILPAVQHSQKQTNKHPRQLALTYFPSLLFSISAPLLPQHRTAQPSHHLYAKITAFFKKN